MFYTYVLKSKKDQRLYIGFSSNLKKRIDDHRNGRVVSTKHRRSFDLIFYEAFKDKKDALRREKYLKSSKGKSTLRLMLRYSNDT